MTPKAHMSVKVPSWLPETTSGARNSRPAESSSTSGWRTGASAPPLLRFSLSPRSKAKEIV